MRIDLNCDLGEGRGDDAALMPFITSANIACGGHAGDEGAMRATVALAQRHGVAIGAHPGFEDRANFGRREWTLPRAEVVALVRRQVEALRVLAPVRHVKLHGALYNLAARDEATADACAEAIAQVDAELIFVGLAGSRLLDIGRRWGLRVVGEAFADRAYASDGTLITRGHPGALLTDPDAVAAQVLQLVREGSVRALTGERVALRAETVCVHGDGSTAVALVRRLRQELADAGVAVRPFHV